MSDLVRCDACPVLCRIRDGRAGACDRYANQAGELVRLDPLLVAQRTLDHDGAMVPFLQSAEEWDGTLVESFELFSTDDPYVWFSDWLGSSTWLDCFYQDYTVDIVAYDVLDAIDWLTIVPNTY